MKKKAAFSTIFTRLIKWSFLSFWRNKLQTIAAVLVMTLTLLTIAIFITLNSIIGITIKKVEQKIDLVVYFNEAVSEDEILALKDQVQTIPEVANLEYIDKAMALEKWQARSINEELKKVATSKDNPLPRSLEIKVKTPDQITKVAGYFETEEIKPLIRKTSLHENQTTIQRLINITKFTREMGLVFSGFFILISVLVVFNTLRLAIHTRKEEIEIMKLVGATNSSIQWPFIIEGTLYGTLALILSFILLFIGFRFLSPWVSKYLGEVMTEWGGNLLGFFLARSWQIILIEFAVGVMIGVGCSLVAMRKYLRV